MRAEDGPEQIMRVAHVGDPIAHRFVDRVFQGLAARFDADDFRAQHPHPRYVQRLASHVFRAHVNGALQAEMCADRSRSDAVLACAGFRDDARLTHLHGEQSLANGVVDFVRARVQQVFALQINARAAELGRQPRSKLQWCGAPGKIFEQ